jgi:hypothetical protein
MYITFVVCVERGVGPVPSCGIPGSAADDTDRRQQPPQAADRGSSAG